MLVFSWAENHEPCIVAAEQPFQELHADAREPVAVGNHNFGDNAFAYGVQKGEKTGALPVDTAAGVLDNFVLGAFALEICALTLEVGVLVGGTNTGVANASSSVRFFCFIVAQSSGNVREPVAPLAGATLGADGFNLALVRPAAKSACADIVRLADGCTGDKFLCCVFQR